MNKYHMRRSDRRIKDGTIIEEIIRSGKYAVIAMCEKNNPYIVTLSYGYDKENNCLYFHCAKKGRKIDCINENSRVCATIIDDGGYLQNECAHRYSTVVISGDLITVESLQEKQHGMREDKY